jgi:hypothetical protein
MKTIIIIMIIIKNPEKKWLPSNQASANAQCGKVWEKRFNKVSIHNFKAGMTLENQGISQQKSRFLASLQSEFTELPFLHDDNRLFHQGPHLLAYSVLQLIFTTVSPLA